METGGQQVQGRSRDIDNRLPFRERPCGAGEK